MSQNNIKKHTYYDEIQEKINQTSYGKDEKRKENKTGSPANYYKRESKLKKFSN